MTGCQAIDGVFAGRLALATQSAPGSNDPPANPTMSRNASHASVPRLEASRFGYFLVQTHIAAQGEVTLVRLTVEDLSSGERRVFESIRELSHFLDQVVEPVGDAKWAPPTSTGIEPINAGSSAKGE